MTLARIQRPSWQAMLSVGALCFLVSGAARYSAVETEAPRHSFLAVEFPCDAVDQSGTRDTIMGQVRHHTLGCKSGAGALSITASVLPPAIRRLTPDALIYRRARGELLENFDGRRTEWSKCEHAGYSCRLLRYVTDDHRDGMARLYLDDKVLVVINAVWAEDADIATAFLESAQAQ